MKLGITHSLVAASLVLGLSALVAGPVQAQGSGLTRAQAKMDRDTVPAMVRWHKLVGNDVLRDDFVMPEGVLSRAEVRAVRDEFLSMHT